MFHKILGKTKTMKKYFTHDGTNQQGPFDISELKTKSITPDTPVWHEGLPMWISAGKVDELKGLFFVQGTPPPFQGNEQMPNPPRPKAAKGMSKTSLFILCGVVFLVVLAVGFMASPAKDEEGLGGSGAGADIYQQKVMTVEEIERATPTDFLSTSGTYEPNFWGDKLKIHGTITNKATVASYKDAVIRVSYYSKTGTELTSADYVIYDNFLPTSTTKFELKIDNMSNASTIGWVVAKATAN